MAYPKRDEFQQLGAGHCLLENDARYRVWRFGSIRVRDLAKEKVDEEKDVAMRISVLSILRGDRVVEPKIAINKRLGDRGDVRLVC